MESSLIRRDIFRQFTFCQHKAYASVRLRETGDDRLESLIASRAESARQAWMEKQHAATLMVESINNRRIAYAGFEATVDYAEWIESDGTWSPFLFSGLVTITREQRLELA